MDLELITRTTAILVAGSTIVALLRRAAPSTRHLVWRMAIVLVVLAPFITPLVPRIAVPGVPNVPEVPMGIVLTAVPASRALVVEPETVGTRQNDALGTLGTITTLGTFAVLAWFGFCWLVHEKAAIALGASGDARAVAPLTRATQDPDAQVREKAVAGLILLGLGGRQ